MWILFALGASALWGFTYVLDEQIYKHISVATSLAIGSFFAFIAMTILAILTDNLSKDLHEISTSRTTLWLVVGGTTTFVIAEFLIGMSISAKNATLAGLIEISYPIFIAFLSYVLFKENRITLPNLLGAVLIFSGIFVIYIFNKAL